MKTIIVARFNSYDEYLSEFIKGNIMALKNDPKDQEARMGARNWKGEESEAGKERRAKKTPTHKSAEAATDYLKKHKRP